MTDAIDRALAELHRRKAQNRAHAEEVSAGARERHTVRADSYEIAANILSEARDPDDATPDTGVTIDADELVIVEVAEAGHRRRTYRRAPDTPGVDARLEVARWHHDGWRVVGEEPVAQLVVNGVRAFDPAEDA